MNLTPRIVHGDLKPANVLLDDDMEARISDFGLSKEIPEAATHITCSYIAGTLGYIAPDYYQTMKFNDRCDIYSFGVLLGVLVGRWKTSFRRVLSAHFGSWYDELDEKDYDFGRPKRSNRPKPFRERVRSTNASCSIKLLVFVQTIIQLRGRIVRIVGSC